VKKCEYANSNIVELITPLNLLIFLIIYLVLHYAEFFVRSLLKYKY